MEVDGGQVPAPSSHSEGGAVTRTALDRVEAELVGVEHALTRLDDDTYGVCEQCQRRLDDELLADRPLARRCPDH